MRDLSKLASAMEKKNKEGEVLSAQERLVFDAMTLHAYKSHREKRGLSPLTKWQEEQLLLERIAAALSRK